MESVAKRDVIKRRSMSIAQGGHDLNQLEKIKSDKNLKRHMGLGKHSPRSQYDYGGTDLYDGQVVYNTQPEFADDFKDMQIPNQMCQNDF